MTTTLTTNEVQRVLKVSRPTLYRLIVNGELPAVKVGRTWRIRQQDLSEYLKPKNQNLPKGSKTNK